MMYVLAEVLSALVEVIGSLFSADFRSRRRRERAERAAESDD
jgi:hypothetical protein